MSAGQFQEKIGADRDMNHPRNSTMLHTYEALLQPDGRLQFADQVAKHLHRPQRVLVTFTGESPPESPATASQMDWRSMVGVLAGSPHWVGDPQAIQQGLRDEWN
jgi:hypothetical protein